MFLVELYKILIDLFFSQKTQIHSSTTQGKLQRQDVTVYVTIVSISALLSTINA